MSKKILLLFFLQKYRTLYQSYNEQKLTIDKVEDLYCLKLEQRWQLYYKTVGCVKSNLLSKMNTLLVSNNCK